MSTGREWWSNKEREMREAEEARMQRWADYCAEHPGSDCEQLRAEFLRAEAVLFTLEQRGK